VTVPQGVGPGDTIHVQAPDGQLNAVVIPPGMVSGSTFTVQFAAKLPPTEQAVGSHSQMSSSSSSSSAAAVPPPLFKYENPPVAFSAPVNQSSGWDDHGGHTTSSPYATTSAQVITDDFASGFGSNGTLQQRYHPPQASIPAASNTALHMDDFASGFGTNARPY
jgi:hypothetical protein